MTKKWFGLIAIAAAMVFLGCSNPSGGGGDDFFTVTFDADGGSPASAAAVTKVGGGTVSLPADPTRAGYTFGGWFTAKDGGETAFAATTSVTANITVYAKWTLVSYTITYTFNSGTNFDDNPAEYTIESALITLAAPTCTGYAFGGWYAEAGFTNTVTEIAAGNTGDKAF
jgi:uncharacterized repeat protein (TIGR02543 family)